MRNFSRALALALLLSLLLPLAPATVGLSLSPANAAPLVLINEIRIDQTGTDYDEYSQLIGSPGQSLDGLTYRLIGDGAVAASSGNIPILEVELHLIEDQDLLLAATSFTVDSSQAERQVQVVEGIDPAVTINEDRLMVKISNVSGASVQVYLRDPDPAEAGGPYVEFPQSRQEGIGFLPRSGSFCAIVCRMCPQNPHLVASPSGAGHTSGAFTPVLVHYDSQLLDSR